jgi:hypothetical protein
MSSRMGLTSEIAGVKGVLLRRPQFIAGTSPLGFSGLIKQPVLQWVD